MDLRWTRAAFSDLARFYEFLAPEEMPAAIQSVQVLAKAPAVLLTNPRAGEQLSQFKPREVRQISIGKYEVRYEIRDSNIYMLRLRHAREKR